jgi:hypothetical protein
LGYAEKSSDEQMWGKIERQTRGLCVVWSKFYNVVGAAAPRPEKWRFRIKSE